MFDIYVINNGRFANNLFQVFAAEIIKFKFKFNNIIITNNRQDKLVISDKEFIEIMTGKKDFLPNSDIVLDGYFQRSEIFEPYRDFLKSLINDKNNHQKINNHFKYSDLANHENLIYSSSNDLIVHFRLDDYIFSGTNNDIFNPTQILEIINNIQYEKLYIVCDKINHNWEKKYLNHFKHLNPNMITNDLLTDFKFIMNSNKILTSASSFAWLAAFLSNANEIHIPINTFYHHDIYAQKLLGYGDMCKTYENISFWDLK